MKPYSPNTPEDNQVKGLDRHATGLRTKRKTEGKTRSKRSGKKALRADVQLRLKVGAFSRWSKGDDE